MTDTIFALSSGRPPAAIAIVRVSGPAALDVASALAGRLPPPRRAALRALRDRSGALLDRALILIFPGPASATGEDLVEFNCHGGRAVIAAVERALAASGARRAHPGEFTRRALLYGRIDLAQAEGLADLLEAETEAQRAAALDAAEGRVGAMVGEWLTRLARLSAQVEASLDFADEDDVGGDMVTAGVPTAAAALAAEIVATLAAPPVERLRDGTRVVIAGPPNAGKSTLLNLLSGRDAAIVSPVSGTTRDRVEAPVSRTGEAYLLTDTAGLTDTDDAVEAAGVERARTAIARADLLLWLGDAPPPRADAIWVHGRADLPGREHLPPGRHLAISHTAPASIEHLWTLIAARSAQLLVRGAVPLLNERQRTLCHAAAAALSEAAIQSDPLLVADDLRHAHAQLAALLGHDATEAMLDELFSRFCIGK